MSNTDNQTKTKNYPQKKTLEVPHDWGFSLVLAEPGIEEELFELTDKNREILAEWLNWVYKTKSIEDTSKFIKLNTERFESEGSGAYTIINSEGKISGLIELQSINQTNNSSNIGYWLGAEFQGNGLITRAVQIILRYGFEDHSLNRIGLLAAVGNKKSRAVAERSGFTYEGIKRQSNRLNEEVYLDMVVYSMLKNEWGGPDKV